MKPASLALALAFAVPIVAGCLSLEPSPTFTAQPGDFVVVDLVREVRDANRTTFADRRMVLAPSLPEDPDRYPDGWDRNTTTSAVPGLVDAMDGMREGETRSTGWLAPAAAYGEVNPDLLDRFDRTTALARTVPNATVEGGEVTAYGRTWNASTRNGSAYIEVGPADDGATVEHPRFWGPEVRMWRSRLVDWNASHLRVRHVVEPGDPVKRGTVRGRVAEVNATTVVVDRNPPLAGATVRFEMTLHRIVFAEPGRTRASDFSIRTIDGDRFRLTDHRGTPVLVYFFATWCTVCRKQTPEVVEAQERLEADLRAVAISIDPNETPDEVRSYAERYRDGRDGPQVAFAVDTLQTRVSNGYNVVSIPKIVLVDADGYLTWTATGHVPADTLVERADDAAS